MAYNGCTVIDMDAHIRERADRFFKDYIDPEHRAAFNRLCEAIAIQESKGDMEFAPVAKDVAVKLFALHCSFYFPQFSDVFLCARHEGAWTSQFAFLIGNEAVWASFAAQFLGRCLERDIG